MLIKINLPICAVRKICASLPEFENFTGCSKNGRAKNGHWSAAKMVIFKNIKKKPIPVTTFEVYRFSLWFSKNSIRWSLPKKCITSLLIITFLKFNEKWNIIHAHRNLISQFVPYEKSVKRSARLSNFWRVCVLSSAKNGHWSAAKMVIFKNIKKSLYQWQLLKSIVSVFGFIKIQYGDCYPKNASRPC